MFRKKTELSQHGFSSREIAQNVIVPIYFIQKHLWNNYLNFSNYFHVSQTCQISLVLETKMGLKIAIFCVYQQLDKDRFGMRHPICCSNYNSKLRYSVLSWSNGLQENGQTINMNNKIIKFKKIIQTKADFLMKRPIHVSIND